jgi:hypothetical protein
MRPKVRKQKSEGPGQWDSYWLAESRSASNPAKLAVLYFMGRPGWNGAGHSAINLDEFCCGGLN